MFCSLCALLNAACGLSGQSLNTPGPVRVKHTDVKDITFDPELGPVFCVLGPVFWVLCSGFCVLGPVGPGVTAAAF